MKAKKVKKVIVQKDVSFVGGFVSVSLKLKDLELDAEDRNIYNLEIVRDEEEPTIYNIIGYEVTDKG